MPLQKQTLPISFSKGVDTKTDPRQIMPGTLVEAQNVVFDDGMAFEKRNGYERLTTLDAGYGIQAFKEELVGFDGAAIQAYNPANQSIVDKGQITGVDIAAQSVFRSANSQTQQDSAVNPGGLSLYVWQDSTNGPQYMVTSTESGERIIAPTNLESNATFARAFSLGNYLIVSWVNSSTNNLRYIAIPVMNPTAPTAAASFAATVDATSPRYDGVVVNGYLYFVWSAPTPGFRYNYLSSSLASGSVQLKSGAQPTTCLGIFANLYFTTPQIWVVFYDGTDVQYYIFAAISLAEVLPVTSAVTAAGVLNVTGAAESQAHASIFYQRTNNYGFTSASGSTVRSDFISRVQADTAGGSGSAAVLARGVGLIGKAFLFNSKAYMLVAYGSYNSQGFEPTYFLIEGTLGTRKIIAKLAATNGGGYPQTPNGMLCNINEVSDGVYEFSYRFKDLITTQTGVVYTNTGVNSAVVSFQASNQYQASQLGNNLNVNGGYLYGYDGNEIVEQNFHLFPEDLGATTATSGGHILDLTAYSYIACYAWTDAEGNIQRSAPSVAFSKTTGNSGTNVNTITVNVPTLRMTTKSNANSKVVVELYRTMPTIATGVYYLVTSVTSPTFNSLTVDSVAIVDTIADVAGQPILYTTGGVIENTGAPAFSCLAKYKNRLFGIDSENRNQLWYSKQTIQNTPVEMSDLLTLYVDPSFGEMGAIAPMDDKLLIFKKGTGAIYYMVGNGPDNTGAQNDFSDPIFINAVCGCDNPDSLALTPDGTMFQANNNKGIWIVDRSLGVSYIGSAVEAFNSFTVTSAQLIPNTTQVRFTLSDNQPTLVYDYFYKQWEFDPYGAIHPQAATLYQSLYTYITSEGLILQETPGEYSDNGRSILMSLTTGWLSLSGFQGYQRLYSIYLIGQYLSTHRLKVTVSYDYDSSNADTVIMTPEMVENPAYGDDPFWGSTNTYGADNGGPTEQFRINVSRQKCQAIQIKIEEVTYTPDIEVGGGLIIEAINLVVGQKGGYPRLSPTKIVST